MQALLDRVLDIALSPALWLCVLFGLVYSVLFTLWRGGGFRQMLRDITAGVLGFAAGQLVASYLHLPTLAVGEVHLVWGSLFAVIALLVGRRYWRPKSQRKQEPRTPARGAPTG
jgi:hypothetical protein